VRYLSIGRIRRASLVAGGRLPPHQTAGNDKGLNNPRGASICLKAHLARNALGVKRKFCMGVLRTVGCVTNRILPGFFTKKFVSHPATFDLRAVLAYSLLIYHKLHEIFKISSKISDFFIFISTLHVHYNKPTDIMTSLSLAS
jgi:hypothetical protein